MECLWYVNLKPLIQARSVDRMKNQMTSHVWDWGLTLFGTTDSCLDRVHLSCEKNWTHMPSTRGSYGRKAGSLADGFLNLLDFNCYYWYESGYT